MARRYTRKRRRKKGRGKTKRQKEVDRVWGAFQKGRKYAKQAAFMKANPLPTMTVAQAFKQPNLSKVEYDFEPLTDKKIKKLEQNLRNLQPASNLTRPGQKFPKKSGGKRKRKTRRKRKRKRRRKSKRRR